MLKVRKAELAKRKGVRSGSRAGSITFTAILILANVGATTESCPYKSGKYLPIIGNFHGCRGIEVVSVPAPFQISFSSG